MPLRNPLARLVQRDPDRLSLRDRLAGLKARLSRPKASTSEGRRSLLAGIASSAVLPLAGSPAAASAIAAPVAVELPSAASNDGSLFEAARVVAAAEEAVRVAREARKIAAATYKAEAPAFPEILILTANERAAIESATGWGGLTFASQPTDDFCSEPRSGWKAAGLRLAIKRATAVLGPAGATPKLLRRWRDILPIAEAHEAAVIEVRERSGLAAAAYAERAAEAERVKAQAAFAMMPAATMEGLALKVRAFAEASHFHWENMPAGWSTLLEAAATLTGIPLPRPDFDPAEWLGRFREAGGLVEFSPVTGEWELTHGRHRVSDEQRGAIQMLLFEAQGRKLTMQRWLAATNGGEA